MNTQTFLVMSLALLGVACNKPPDERMDRGAELLAPFKAELQAALKHGLQDGPAEAITVCRVEAPRIARALSVDDIQMGRSSDRLRNPANTAPEWVVRNIESYRHGSKGYPNVGVELEDGRFGYTEPIMIQPLCLTCHGTEIHPDVAARLEALYPDDAATGYDTGDFRGVFWVEF